MIAGIQDQGEQLGARLVWRSRRIVLRRFSESPAP
jgi:hypothetical protein